MREKSYHIYGQLPSCYIGECIKHPATVLLADTQTRCSLFNFLGVFKEIPISNKAVGIEIFSTHYSKVAKNVSNIKTCQTPVLTLPNQPCLTQWLSTKISRDKKAANITLSNVQPEYPHPSANMSFDANRSTKKSLSILPPSCQIYNISVFNVYICFWI